MRIVHEFNLGPLKCTLMLHDSRYTLKIEDEYGEVNYKLGQHDRLDSAELSSFMDIPQIKKSIIAAFRAMRTGRDELLHLMSDDVEDTFDEII